MGDKANELNCINMVIPALQCQDKFDQGVAKMLCGVEAERELYESPDFVRLSRNASNDHIILGIEHFRVDHLSKSNAKKPNVIQATNMEDEKKLKRLIKEKLEVKTEENIQTLLDLVAAQSGRQIEAQYNDYIKTFEYSLSRHISNIETYKKALAEIAEKEHRLEKERCIIKLALLIEIHTGFHRLFFNDETGSKYIDVCKKELQGRYICYR